MKFRKQFTVSASAIERMCKLEALITEALQRIYASHVEKIQMRLAPIKLIRHRTQRYRDW
jgi:hypothetical protein